MSTKRALFHGDRFSRFLAPALAIALTLGLGLGATPVFAETSTEADLTETTSAPETLLELDSIPEPCGPSDLSDEATPEEVAESASPSNSESASPTPSSPASESPTDPPSESPTESESEAVASPADDANPFSSERSIVLEDSATPTPSESDEPTPVESTELDVEATPSATPSPSPSANEQRAVECVGVVSDLVATADVNAVNLSWSVPTGVEPEAFYVRVSGTDRIVGVAAPATGVNVSGLRNGVQYGFTVIAANEDGSGSASAEVFATPSTGAEGEVAGLIVGFAEGVQVTDSQTNVPGEASVGQVDLTVSSELIDGVHTVDLSESVSIEVAQQIAAELASDPAVDWAEPDQFVFAAESEAAFPNAPPNDEQYASAQWNLWDTYGIGIGDGSDEMTKALVANQGEGTTIAVIDTGIAPHADLAEQLVDGYDFVSNPEALASARTSGGSIEPFDADSVDEGRFGSRGWDANPTDPGDWRGVVPVRDSSWHGTKVAGVIAAQANNENGIIGVAPKAKVQPIRALSWRGGLISDIAASITWASGGVVDGVPTNQTPADVINMSFAVESVCSVALQGAINAAFERGSVLVAAAGNANDDVAKYAPANCENVIAVGATGRDGKRAAYSNFGSGIDISAPGGAITGDGGVITTSNTGLLYLGDESTATTEGTSVAAAHVSAAAAFVTAWQPGISATNVRSLLVGKDSVRPFADESCDADPSIQCGNGILNLAQIASAGEPGVNMSLATGGSLIADGSTVAYGSRVTVGSAGLLSPGSGYRELRTSLDTTTKYASGSAVAPEGWAVHYSTNKGSSWVNSEPSPATNVTDVKASATASAGLIEGTSQIYSSETKASIPSTNFSTSTGGDGWDTFFYEDYVFNIFHHANQTVLDCHYRSDGERCTGYKATFSGYRASMRSGGWVDATTGKLYALTSSTSTNKAGALCIDVSQSGAPTSCGFIELSTTLSSNNYNYLTESEYVGRRFFGAVYGYDKSEALWGTQLLCYDAALQAVCPNSPISLVGGTYDQESLSNVRPMRVQDKILVKTTTRIYCFVAATLNECSDQSKWPVTINSKSKTPVAPHTTATGIEDGICYQSGCIDLNGEPQPTWVTPFTLGYSNWAMHAVVGGLGGTRYFWAAEPLTVRCFDYATNAACKIGATVQTKDFPGYNLIYSTKPDPENPSCIWVNSDAGKISVFDSQTLNTGCSNNPVITLQPSQFAPRYACSTSSGVTEWSALRLVSIGGGGTASSVQLTVRDSTGAPVTGWAGVPVTLGSTLDMTGLNPSVSSSRPTFSFAFSGISGSVTTAVIALDYKGKGPELCVDAIATSGTPVRADVTGALLERVGVDETYTTNRYFNIGAATSTVELTVPSAPLNLAGTGLNTTATLTFSPPTLDGNLTLGDYQLSRDGGSTWSDIVVVDNGDGSLSTRITGLTLGTTYPMRLAATNSLGRGNSASLSVTTQTATIDTLPDTPVNLGPITLAARTNEEIDITYSTMSSACHVTGTTVTLVSQGLCVISASAPSSGAILAYSGKGDFTILPAYIEVTEPGTPSSLTATPSSTQVNLAWTEPLSDGGAAITDYLVQYKSGSTWTLFNDGTSTGTTAVVPGLTNGTLYSFRVAAVNSEGVGVYTDSVTATPATVPGAATSLSASRSSTSASLSWSAPASNGGSAITDYTVEYKLSSDASWTPFPDGVRTATGATVTGLDSGASYDFRVSAVNSIGQGAFTSTANLTASAGNEQVVLTWTQPTFTGGEIFDHYEVEYRLTETPTWFTFSSSVATTTSTVSGLSNGTSYDFRVAIVTSASTSSYTSVATSTPRTTPSAPADAVAIPGNRQVEFTWTAPSDGGSAITDYIIDFKASSATAWTRVVDPVSSATSVTITSLPNGTLFDFRIASVNAVGTGAYSATLNATPRTVPGAPVSLTATPSNGAVGLTWTAPSVTGGAAIRDYKIEYRLSSAFGWTTFVDGLSSAAAVSVPGLTNGALYEFRVSAVNEAGAGTASSVVSGRPFTVPGAPTSLAVSDLDSDKVLTWTAPASNGGSAITDYRVDYKISSDATWVTFSDGTSSSTGATITGLTSGVLYDFRIAAVNAAGISEFTSTVNVTTVPGDTQVTVSWNPPTFTGGEALDSYKVEFRPSSDSTWSAGPTGTSTTAVVTGLVNGLSYDFHVITSTTTSTSSFSSLVSSTPRTVPGAPVSLTATPSNGAVGLTWTAPSVTGGAAITDYKIEYQEAIGASSWTTLVDGVGTALSTRITGLGNGTAYKVRISAVNAVGSGLFSTESTATPMTTPGQVTGLGAVSGDTQMTLSWSTPINDGGSPITDYLIEYRLSSATSWTVHSDGVSTSLSATIGGLTNGSLYQFRVAAINVAGTGSVSGIASGTPKTTPGVPTGIASTIGDAFVSLTWTAPSNDGGSAVSDYTIEYKLSADSVWIVYVDGVRTLPSVTILGLKNNYAYDFRVAATNSKGSSPFTSHVSATPLSVPEAPIDLKAVYGNTTTALTWDKPTSDGGSAITDYVIQYRPSSTASWFTFNDGVGTATSRTITGLTNGTTYFVRVAAVNTAGTSLYSNAESTIPRTVPTAPLSLAAARGNLQITLTWNAPSSTGGADVTNYLIEYKENTSSTWTTFNDAVTTGRSQIIPDLNNGTLYNFRVSAINSEGTGQVSSTANGTPSTVAGSPTGVTLEPANTALGVSWTAPISTGGASITNYIVQFKVSTAGPWTTLSGSRSTTTANITGLTNGTTYAVQIIATNAAGDSSPSTQVTAAPRTTPGPPTALIATFGDRQASLSWTAPVSTGGASITDYVLEYKRSTDSTWTEFTDGVSSVAAGVVTGLTNGTLYEFRIRAVNAAGQGSNSTTATTTPLSTPSAPVDLEGDKSDKSVDLTWAAPLSDGGSARLNYIVRYRLSGSSSWITHSSPVASATNATLTGLVNGSSYDVEIAGVNAQGTGSAAQVSLRPRTTPGTPTGLSATSGNTQVSLSWVAPVDDGGSDVIDYVIEYRSSGTLTWQVFTDGVSGGTTAVVTGLSNGNAYEFVVTAINEAGDGIPTSEVTASPIAPVSLPSEPIPSSSVPTVPAEAVEVELTFTDEGVLLINGVPVSLDITPSPDGGSWAVQGPDFSLTFTPQRTASGSFSGPGKALSTPAGGWVAVLGDGYKGNTKVKAYLIPRPNKARSLARASGPIFLGEVDVRADGTFDIQLTVPSDINEGNYVLQINGLSPESSVRSVNMALGVTAPLSVSELASMSTSRQAFFQPRSAKFSNLGLKRIRTVQASIPAGAQDVVVSVMGVSVSMDDLQSNLLLAGKRAQRIVNYLQKRKIEGKYNVTVNTSVKFGSADRLSDRAKRSNKPLTTVSVTFSAAS